ncbi:MAG: hypothetical protein KC502_09595 [Myxococcales bacterium]|nr:hypothetical protein [Myxococcales bacterium]
MSRNAGQIVIAAVRWVDAVNAPSEVARLHAACAPVMTVERMGVFDKKGRLAETFVGIEQVTEWLQRLPEGIFFELSGAPEPAPKVGADVWQIRYLYRIPSLQFTNGGTWHLRLDAAGQVSWLRHDPDPLPDELAAGGQDRGGEPEHSHDDVH